MKGLYMIFFWSSFIFFRGRQRHMKIKKKKKKKKKQIPHKIPEIMKKTGFLGKFHSWWHSISSVFNFLKSYFIMCRAWKEKEYDF